MNGGGPGPRGGRFPNRGGRGGPMMNGGGPGPMMNGNRGGRDRMGSRRDPMFDERGRGRGRGRGGRGRDDYSFDGMGPRGRGREMGGRGMDRGGRGMGRRGRGREPELQPPDRNTAGRFAGLGGGGPRNGPGGYDNGPRYGGGGYNDRNGRGGNMYGGYDRRDNMRGGRGRGRGRRGPDWNPTGNMSKNAGMMHQAQAIAKFEKLPDWIKKFNKVQEKIIGDLCLGNDNVIVSPAGSGKSMALIIAAFYRLYTKKAPAHVMFICADHLHAETLTNVCLKLGAHVPDLTINKQVRGERYVQDRQLDAGRNIFICSPGKAIALCEDFQLKKARDKLINNLVSVNLFDADQLLAEPLLDRVQQTFRYIPTNINVNFVSNSYCQTMERNLKMLVSLESPKTKKHILDHNHDNLKFWFIFSEGSLKMTMLKELCKVNPYR